MSPKLIAVCLGVALAVGVIVLAVAATIPLVPEEGPPEDIAPGVDPTRTRPAWDSLVRVTTAAAPFRPSRRPSALVYDPARLEEPPGPPPPPKPKLVLAGMVWGRRPMVILEGVPGLDGARLLSVGDTAGGLRLSRITRAGATVVGFDTTWTLEVRNPWP